MRIGPFLLGLALLTLLAFAAGWSRGLSALALTGLVLLVLLVGQLAYLGLIALMARDEARHRRAADAATSPKPEADAALPRYPKPEP